MATDEGKANSGGLYLEHMKTYDALAVDYEARGTVTASQTEKSIDWFMKYLRDGDKVLDVGCGVGGAAQIMWGRGLDVTAVDISAKMLSFARQKVAAINIIEGDFLTTKFDDAFDGIFAFAFIHLFSKE